MKISLSSNSLSPQIDLPEKFNQPSSFIPFIHPPDKAQSSLPSIMPRKLLIYPCFQTRKPFSTTSQPPFLLCAALVFATGELYVVVDRYAEMTRDWAGVIASRMESEERIRKSVIERVRMKFSAL